MIMKNNEEIVLKCISACIDNKKMYFSAWNTNGFFCYDFISGNVELLTMLPIQECLFGYGYILCVDDSVFLSPCDGNSIIELDKNNWQNYRTYLVDDSKLGAEYARLGEPLKVGSSIYFTPYKSHSIVEYEIDSHNIHYHSDCYEMIKDKIKDDNLPLFTSAVLVDKKIWFVCLKSNDVICFDTESKSTSIYQIDDGEHTNKVLQYDGKFFWIYTSDDKLIKWNENSKKIFQLDNVLGTNTDWASMCIYKDSVILTYDLKKGIVVVDLATSTKNLVQLNLTNDEEHTYGGIKVINDELYLLPNQSEYLYQIDLGSKSALSRRITLSGEDYYDFLYKIIDNNAKNGGVTIEKTHNLLKPFLRKL